jgi:hypothetical protein
MVRPRLTGVLPPDEPGPQREDFKTGPPLRVQALVGVVTCYNLSRRAFGDRLDIVPPRVAGRAHRPVLARSCTADIHSRDESEEAKG